MTVVSRFVLCVVQSALLSACAMGVYEVPIGSVDAVPSDVERLQIGQRRRDDVLAALGGDPLVLFSSDGFEIYQLSTGRSSVGIALLFPLIPVPFPARELQEGQLRILAVYDDDDDDAGVVRRLDWEHARFSKSPLRDERREPLSEPLVMGFEEAGGPLVVDAYGAAGTAVSVDPAALPAPRLVWEADTIRAATQGAFATLGESATGGLTVRELASGAVIASTRPPADSCGPHTGWLQADGRHVLLASTEGDLCLWDISSGEPASPLAASDADTKPRATRVAVARRVPRAATYNAVTRTVSIWDTHAGDLRATLPVGEAAAVALSSDGERLAIVDQKMELAVLSMASGEELERARLSGPRPSALKWSRLAVAPDGRTFAVNRVTHVEIWRLARGGESAAIPDALHLNAVLLLPITERVACPVPLAFSANGGRLAAGCNSAVVWETNTWRELLRLVPDAEGKIGGEQAWIDEGFALSADGRTILTTHGVWDVPDLAPAPNG